MIRAFLLVLRGMRQQAAKRTRLHWPIAASGVNGGVGQYTIGTFTADATTQTFTLTRQNSSGSTQINAIQVRDTGAITLSAARDNLATASGGTVNNSGGYVTITFTGSGSITLPGTVNGVSELIVGGGGSGASGWGGSDNDGGGGGGGVLNLTGQTLGTSTTVTIGNAGGQSSPGNPGQQGGSSSIGGNTAGGGLGGQRLWRKQRFPPEQWRWLRRS